MNNDDYRESLISDVFLCLAIGNGLAWVAVQWWFAQ